MEILIMAPHVLAGLLALALYWRTLLAAKGSRPHRRWGRVYLVMLLPLLASVVPVSLHLGKGNPARMAQIVYPHSCSGPPAGRRGGPCATAARRSASAARPSARSRWRWPPAAAA